MLDAFHRLLELDHAIAYVEACLEQGADIAQDRGDPQCSPAAASQRSTSIAAAQPVPAAVTACRYT